MKQLVLFAVLASPVMGCETTQLYEGDRDPFARMVEVMETMDISPSDRGTPAPLAIGQPLPPPVLAASPTGTNAFPAPPAEMADFPAPPAEMADFPAPPAEMADFPAPAPIAATEPPPTSQATAPPAATRRRLPAAARLAIVPKQRGDTSLALDDPPSRAEPMARHKPVPLPLPAVMPNTPTLAPKALPEPIAPAPPAPEPSTPKRPAVIADAENQNEGPTAREAGRGLIKRSNRVSARAQGTGAGFTSADGQMGSELGADIGGQARPIAPRSAQSTRKVISDAKGDLAECYVNEQLFQDDAKGTTIVVIEVPKELPNLPRIETSDFSETMNICLLEAVRNLPFPGDPDGMVYRLRIPFRFRPD